MKGLRLLLALGAFFVAAAGLSACGSGMPGNAVANVAGNPISTTAFDHWMFVAAKGNSSQSPGSPVIVPNDPPQFKNCIAQVRAQIPTLAKQSDKTIQSDCKQLFTSLSGQVMDFLIRASWYQALAYKLHIKISNAQIQQAFDAAKKQQFPTATAFQDFLNSSGQTLQDILFRVRVNQIYSKLLARHETTVTNAEIENYFRTHQSQFGTPEKRNIRIVRTSSEAAANAAKSALDSGQSWDAVVKKYSVDAATKKTGGLLVGVTEGQEEQALNTASFAAPANIIGLWAAQKKTLRAIHTKAQANAETPRRTMQNWSPEEQKTHGKAWAVREQQLGDELRKQTEALLTPRQLQMLRDTLFPASAVILFVQGCQVAS